MIKFFSRKSKEKLKAQIEWFLIDREEKGLPIGDKKRYLLDMARIVPVDDMRRFTLDDAREYHKALSQRPGGSFEFIERMRALRFFLRYCRRLGMRCPHPDLIGDLSIREM